MTELQKSITPFLKYFESDVKSFPASTTIANSIGLEAFDQHICDCLDKLRHLYHLYEDYTRLKSTIPKINEIERELHKAIPSLFQ